MRTVLRGARWPRNVAVRDGWIEAVGTVQAEPDDRVIDCEGGLITAGFVNTHHHLYQWMTRGRCTGCDLFGWLTELYPVWARLTPEDVHAAALVGLAELAVTGCTTAADHHYLVPGGDDSVFDALAAAAKTVGVRLHLARGSMDLGESHGGLPPDSVVEDADAILASTESVMNRLHDGVRIVVTVAPCSPFTASPELMRGSVDLARRHGLRMHTHLAETKEEQADCLERFGRRPLAVLDDLGWIADDVWVAHGVHFDDGEIRRLGEAGTGVAHCPSSNARLASGMCRVTDLVGAGVPVGLGVDGVASNEVGGLSCRPTRSDSPPRAARHAWAATTSAGSSRGSGPTWWCGPATTWPTCPTPWRAWCSGPTGAPGLSWWTASPWWRRANRWAAPSETGGRTSPAGPGGSGPDRPGWATWAC